ncbi:MAG: GNAT family N-acetyltransferase [Anaerolineae bacterium]|jgi:ribosomal protein S18 acetylase RimI-like enzyme
MATVDLRPAKPDDYDFVFSVHAAAMRRCVEQTYGWDEDWQAHYLREHFDPVERQIIRYDGTDVGYISIEEQKTSFFLNSIAILPAYQGLGIGTTLIRRLQQKARRKEVPVKLRVLKGNPARALYERLAFTVTGETDTHYRMKWSSIPEPTEGSYAQPE